MVGSAVNAKTGRSVRTVRKIVCRTSKGNRSGERARWSSMMMREAHEGALRTSAGWQWTRGSVAVRAAGEGADPLTTVAAASVDQPEDAATAPALAAPAQSPESPIDAAKRNGTVINDTEFNISQVSFGTIGSVVGVIFLLYGFFAYFDIAPGGPISSLILTYGFPITLLGFALKYAELKPVPCVTYAKASGLRTRQATPILLQVKDDVTRFRYGDEQHLDLAMERIFRIGRGGGVSRRECPVLTGIREEVAESIGTYALVLEFEAKKLGLDGFLKYQEKFQTFFGPGITCEMKQNKWTPTAVDVWLVSNGDAVGGGEDDDEFEILPPLMPGLPARRQKKQQ